MKTLRITSSMLAVMLLASGATQVVAAGKKTASKATAAKASKEAPKDAEAKSYWVRFKEGASSVGGRVKGAATTAYDYTLKPYSSYSQDEKDAIFTSIEATADKYAPEFKKGEQPSKFAEFKSWMANKYVAARKGMYNHPYIATPVWYAGLAAAVLGSGYGVYKVYVYTDAKLNPANLEAIKSVAAQFKDAQNDEASIAFRKAIAKNKSVIKALHELAEVDATALNHLLHALEVYSHELESKTTTDISNAFETLVAVVDGCVAKVKASKEAPVAAPAA